LIEFFIFEFHFSSRLKMFTSVMKMPLQFLIRCLL